MRLARWVLTRCIAPDRQDAIIGDLEEDYARHRSNAQYLKETLLVLAREPSLLSEAAVFTLLLGLAGAAAQIAIAVAHLRGPYILFPYPIVILAAAFYVRHRYASAFAVRFWIVLAAFMCMTIVFYFALFCLITPRGVGNIPLFGHVWRLGVMLAIGSGAAAAIALMTGMPFGALRRDLFVIALGALGTGAFFVGGFARWPGFLTAAASILGVAAIYIYFARIHGFASRYAVVAIPFVFAVVAIFGIQAWNYPYLTLPWVRIGYFVGAGCAIAAAIARFTPTRSADARGICSAPIREERTQDAQSLEQQGRASVRTRQIE